MDCSLPGSSSHKNLQAKLLEWVATLSSSGSSQPRDGTWVSCIADKFFTTEPLGKPKVAPIKSKVTQCCFPPFKWYRNLKTVIWTILSILVFCLVPLVLNLSVAFVVMTQNPLFTARVLRNCVLTETEWPTIFQTAVQEEVSRHRRGSHIIRYKFVSLAVSSSWMMTSSAELWMASTTSFWLWSGIFRPALSQAPLLRAVSNMRGEGAHFWLSPRETILFQNAVEYLHYGSKIRVDSPRHSQVTLSSPIPLTWPVCGKPYLHSSKHVQPFFLKPSLPKLLYQCLPSLFYMNLTTLWK